MLHMAAPVAVGPQGSSTAVLKDYLEQCAGVSGYVLQHILLSRGTWQWHGSVYVVYCFHDHTMPSGTFPLPTMYKTTPL